MRESCNKLLRFISVAMSMTLCFFIGNAWSSGTSRGFTVDFSNAVFSRSSENALQMQTTGVAVSLANSSGQTSYNVVWSFSYSDNNFHIVSVTNSATGSSSSPGGNISTVPNRFSVYFNNATFAGVPGNALQMQTTGAAVSFVDSSGQANYTVLWEFNYTDNNFHIVSATADTSNSGTTVTDIDGNVYNTVTIGAQTWMKENLKVTKYRNGDVIPTTTPATLDISTEASPKYQWAYASDESYVATYGRLYTWFALTDSRGVCPIGWHLPADSEWAVVIDSLGGENVAGGKMKESGTTHWNSPNTGADNSSGFTALPGGSRYDSGAFINIGYGSHWWAATENSATSALYCDIGYYSSSAFRLPNYKSNGYSVRCVRD